MTKLNVGSGTQALDGYVNCDIADVPGVDCVFDLDIAPWPFDDASVEEVVALDVFEHVSEPITFMCEAWRVLVPDGLLRIRVPHWKGENAYTDPTHKRFPTEFTFDYWVPGTVFYENHNPAYGGVAFLKDFHKLHPRFQDQLLQLRKVPGHEG